MCILVTPAAASVDGVTKTISALASGSATWILVDDGFEGFDNVSCIREVAEVQIIIGGNRNQRLVFQDLHITIFQPNQTFRSFESLNQLKNENQVTLRQKETKMEATCGRMRDKKDVFSGSGGGAVARRADAGATHRSLRFRSSHHLHAGLIDEFFFIIHGPYA
jgi:hypothetical protein